MGFILTAGLTHHKVSSVVEVADDLRFNVPVKSPLSTVWSYGKNSFSHTSADIVRQTGRNPSSDEDT